MLHGEVPFAHDNVMIRSGEDEYFVLAPLRYYLTEPTKSIGPSHDPIKLHGAVAQGRGAQSIMSITDGHACDLGRSFVVVPLDRKYVPSLFVPVAYRYETGTGMVVMRSGQGVTHTASIETTFVSPPFL